MPAPQVATNVDVKVTAILNGAKIAAVVEKTISVTYRTVNSLYDHDGRESAVYPDHGFR